MKIGNRKSRPRRERRTHTGLFGDREAVGLALGGEGLLHLLLFPPGDLVEEHGDRAQQKADAGDDGDEGEHGEVLPAGEFRRRRDDLAVQHFGGLEADDHIHDHDAAGGNGGAELVDEALAGGAERVVAVPGFQLHIVEAVIDHGDGDRVDDAQRHAGDDDEGNADVKIDGVRQEPAHKRGADAGHKARKAGRDEQLFIVELLH